MDDLKLPEPFPGVNTIYKALMRRADDPVLGAKDMLGTKVGKEYQWMSWKLVAETAKKFAAGAESMNLTPEVEADGETWKFMGVQSKNRKEWNIVHLSNMFHKATTVGLYDTLGE